MFHTPCRLFSYYIKPGSPFFEDEVREGLRTPSFRFSKTLLRNELPERLIPDDVLQWKTKVHLDGSMMEDTYFPHLHGHPTTLKAYCKVKLSDLPLTPNEQERFKVLVGQRYNPKTNYCYFMEKRFPHRIENKRYLLYLMELLVKEAKDPKYDLLEQQARQEIKQEKKMREEGKVNPHQHVPPFVRRMIGYKDEV